MIKKYQFILIFIPVILLSIGLLVYLVQQYKPLLPNDNKYQKAEEIKSFYIPILADDPTFGDSKTTTTIIVFEDYNCAECKKNLDYFQNILSKYPDQIKLVWKNIVLNNLDDNKILLNKYAYCASEQKQFWPFQMFVFENDKTLSASTLNAIINKLDINTKNFEKCLNNQKVSDYIQRNQIIAQLLGIKTLPTIFFNNKQIYSTKDLTSELNNLFGQK